MEGPKTITLLSAFAVVEENPEMWRIIEDKKGFSRGNNRRYVIELQYRLRRDQQSDLRALAGEYSLYKDRNLVLHRLVYYYSGS